MAARDRIPSQATIALSVAQLDPSLGVDIDSSPGGAAARGAASGALQCGRFFQIGGGGLIVGVEAFLALACLPFGAAIGAIAAAPSGKQASGANIQSAEERLATVGKSLELPKRLEAQIQRYAQATGLQGTLQLGSDATPAHGAAPDYVIEITLNTLRATTPGSAKLPYRFLISGHGRLVRRSDKSVLDEFSHTSPTHAATVDQWTLESFASREVAAALQDLAAAFIDEWLLIYRGAATDITPTSPPFMGTGRTPDYAIEPVEPPVERSRKRKNPAFAAFHVASEVQTLTPVLAWRKLPASIPEDLFSGTSPRARNLVYDVRVFDARTLPGQHKPPIVIPAKVIRSYSDVQATTVQVEKALMPCRYYFWSVRARFELDGRARATEWSFGTPDLDPVWQRRSMQPSWVLAPAHAAYYPFATRDIDGQRCRGPRLI